jgi:uncharacterized protein (TIGR02996 family)
MPIWFVYRSPYDGPMSKHVQRLDGADTLLDWFRAIWQPIPIRDVAYAHAEQLLGTYAYSFGYFFMHIAEENLPRPETTEAMHDALESALYVGEYRRTDDTIQIATDDDDAGLALYWFTDAFARKHPERVAYLLRDDWHLPETVGPGGFVQKPGVRRLLPPTDDGKAVYLVHLDAGSCGDMDDLCAARKLPGLRLADLVPWLLTLDEKGLENAGEPVLYHLHEALQALLRKGKGLEKSFRKTLLDQPDDAVTWAAYSDWLADQDLPAAPLHLLDLAMRGCIAEARGGKKGRRKKTPPPEPQVGPHHAAAIIPQDGANEYDQWYLFDDVWASGNVDLANALLDYSGRFNVLDDWDVPNEDGPDVPAGEEHGPD